MLRILLTSALVLLACPYLAAQSNDSLLETGAAAKLAKPPDEKTAMAIATYNIRWRTGDELTQICKWLKDKHAVVIALQEVDRAKERTKRSNNARAVAEELGMYYAWAAPPLAKSPKDNEEETGVELLSPYPLRDVMRLVLPHEGPGGRRRVALGATIEIGKTRVRVYSVHSETRIPIEQKADQLRAVLTDLDRFAKSLPAVVMGDFNSWEPTSITSVRQLFTSEGFSTPFADEDDTFKRNAIIFDLDLKLDWIWLRGMKAKSFGIDRGVTVSDHFPLWTVTSIAP